MAKTLREWPGINSSASRFDRFLDGQIWQVTAHELRVKNGETARVMLRRRAKELSKRVKFFIVEAGGDLDVIVVHASEDL